MSLRYSPKRLRDILLGFAFALTAVGVAIQLLVDPLGSSPASTDLASLAAILHSASEPSLANLFSTVVLLGCAAATGAIAAAKRSRDEPYAAHWIGLALVLLYFGIDEGVALHEATITPLQSLLEPGGPFFFAWVVPAIAFALVFVLAYARFFLDLPDRIRFEIVLGLGMFLGAAIGFEMAEGVLLENQGSDSFEFAFAITLEELVEMCGLAVLSYALLVELGVSVGTVRIELSTEGERGLEKGVESSPDQA